MFLALLLQKTGPVRILSPIPFATPLAILFYLVVRKRNLIRPMVTGADSQIEDARGLIDRNMMLWVLGLSDDDEADDQAATAALRISKAPMTPIMIIPASIRRLLLWPSMPETRFMTRPCYGLT